MMNDFGKLPAPRYQLFQSVRVVAILESRLSDDAGYVTGIAITPPGHCIEGWYYQVEFHRMPGCPWLTMPYSYFVHESEVFPAKGGSCQRPNVVNCPSAEHWVSTKIAAHVLGITCRKLLAMRSAGKLRAGYHYLNSSGSGSSRPDYQWNVTRLEKLLQALTEYSVATQRRKCFRSKPFPRQPSLCQSCR